MAARAGIVVPECQPAAKPEPRETGAELAAPELATPPRFSDPFGNSFPSEWSEKGVKAYLAGDVDTALAEVDRLEDYVDGDFQRWRLRLGRVDMMMMAGRADEATRIFMERFNDRAKSGEYGPAWLAARDVLIEAGFPPGAYGAFALGGALRDSAGAGAERS